MITILGKSSYAIGIISDILLLTEPGLKKIQIIANIPDNKNDSKAWDYKLPELEYIEKEFSDWTPSEEDQYILGSIGKGRKAIYTFFNTNYGIRHQHFMQIIHPRAVLGSGVTWGVGFHLSPLSVVAPFARFGNFVVINRNASVGHHTILHDFVSINPGVNISGLCEIGEGTTIGTGACVLDKIKIGSNTIIGAGSVVTKDIPDNVIAYGSPAKVVRDRT